MTKRGLGPCLIVVIVTVTVPRVVRADPGDDVPSTTKPETPATPETTTPATDAAPVDGAAAQSTGVIEVPQGLMTITVDGEYRRVHERRVIVSCGKHRINAGRGTQTINVPCDGIVKAATTPSTPSIQARDPREQTVPVRGTNEHEGEKRWPLKLRIEGSYSAHRFFQIPLNGGEGGVGLAAQPFRQLSIGGFSSLFIGATENGLRVFLVRAGIELEGVVDRFRLGGGVSAVLAGVHRALRHDTIVGARPVLHLAASFEFVRSTRVGIFARVVGEVAQNLWGGSLGLGANFDLSGHAGTRAQEQ